MYCPLGVEEARVADVPATLLQTLVKNEQPSRQGGSKKTELPAARAHDMVFPSITVELRHSLSR
jgi:hypothetical protein